MSNWIDLGNDHRVQVVKDRSGLFHSFVDEHKKPDGSHCSGSGRIVIAGDPKPLDGSPYWEMTSYDPLTLTPSLQCTVPDCLDHGWVKDGKWIPA